MSLSVISGVNMYCRESDVSLSESSGVTMYSREGDVSLSVISGMTMYCSVAECDQWCNYVQ